MVHIKKRTEINVVDMVHKFTDCNAQYLLKLFDEAGMNTLKIRKEIGKFTSAFMPCISSCRPPQSRKISLKHVIKHINVDINAYFMTIKYKGNRHKVINVVNTNTA